MSTATLDKPTAAKSTTNATQTIAIGADHGGVDLALGADHAADQLGEEGLRLELRRFRQQVVEVIFVVERLVRRGGDDAPRCRRNRRA